MKIKTLDRIVLCVVAVCFLMTGCKARKITPDDYLLYQDARLNTLCTQEGVRCEWDSIGQMITIFYKDSVIRAMVGSSVVIVNEMPVELSAPLKMAESQVLLPHDFQRKVFELAAARKTPAPGLKPPPAVMKGLHAVVKVREVIIDAGHGGKDPGALGYSGSQEKDIVLDLSRRIQKNLESNGVKVRMTRTTDQFLTLKERSEIAGSGAADLFVSIHANSSPSQSASGIEVYTLKDLTFEEQREEQRRDNETMLMKKLSMQQDKHVRGIISSMLYAHKQKDSEDLAGMIVDELSRVGTARNRGVKEARFFVLRNTLIPAVLIESGFLTNPREDALLKDKAYRQKLANGISKAILNYMYK